MTAGGRTVPMGEGGELWVLSRRAVREVDRLAVDRYGLPSIVLMENAAIALRERAIAILTSLGARSAVILAGPGNNGGDGLALARHLHNAGCEVLVLLSGDPAAYRGDAATNLGVLRAMGTSLERLDRASGAEQLERAIDRPVLIVDALLGTGLREAARGVIRDAILQVNRRSVGGAVLAVDVPSGLDCDTGEPAGGGAAVEANETVTFVGLKRGFLRLQAQRWTGEVTVAGIGVPRELVAELGERAEDARRGLSGSERTASEPGDEPRADPPASHARGVGSGGDGV